ncbi:unnamed protein product, partial [Prorocentrum cordatum]
LARPLLAPDGCVSEAQRLRLRTQEQCRSGSGHFGDEMPGPADSTEGAREERRRRRRRRRSSSRKRRLPPPAGEARALGAPESSAEEPDLGRLLLLAFAASPAGLGAAALERAGQGRVDAAPASCCILAARKAARSRSSRSSSLLRHGLPALRRGGPRRAARGRRGGPG